MFDIKLESLLSDKSNVVKNSGFVKFGSTHLILQPALPLPEPIRDGLEIEIIVWKIYW